MSRWSNFIEAPLLAADFDAKLKAIQAASPNAVAQGKSECCRSGVCCWQRPGELAPEDVPAIAAKLGLTEAELFQQYLLVDNIRGTTLLLPRRKRQPGGRMLDWRESYSIESPCVFLDVDDGNACTIHDVKPTACRGYGCWRGDRKALVPFPEDALKALGWDGVNPDDEDEEDY